MTEGSIKKVIVVGAGPIGLLLALNLAKAGISVDVLEAASRVDESLRAALHSAPGIIELRRAGVLEDVRAAGYIPRSFTFRKLDGAPIASLSTSDLPDDYADKRTCLPVGQLCEILKNHLAKHSIARVFYATTVRRVGQGGRTAWAEVESSGGLQRYDADFVVGCDGAKSIVRRSLFGERAGFPGRSWDVQIVTTNVYYDGFDRAGWDDINLVIDPKHWFMSGRLPGNLWRVTYGEDNALTKEQCIERQPKKWEEMLPGHPKPDQYKLTHIMPYRIHQRCAEHMRVGRIMLAGDAGHICNPFAGIGLTSGMVDAGGLFDCLIGIHNGVADMDILDKYDTVRREIYHKVVDPQSDSALQRMWTPVPNELSTSDPLIKKVIAAQGNKVLATEIQLAQNAPLQHDFTQYYHEPYQTRA